MTSKNRCEKEKSMVLQTAAVKKINIATVKRAQYHFLDKLKEAIIFCSFHSKLEHRSVFVRIASKFSADQKFAKVKSAYYKVYRECLV